MLTLIALPSDMVANIASTTGQLFSDFSPLITLVLGVLLLATVIGIIINTLKKH
jgi:hypothetical protein